jgi:hypothetical protein
MQNLQMTLSPTTRPVPGDRHRRGLPGAGGVHGAGERAAAGGSVPRLRAGQTDAPEVLAQMLGQLQPSDSCITIEGIPSEEFPTGLRGPTRIHTFESMYFWSSLTPFSPPRSAPPSSLSNPRGSRERAHACTAVLWHKARVSGG